MQPQAKPSPSPAYLSGIDPAYWDYYRQLTLVATIQEDQEGHWTAIRALRALRVHGWRPLSLGTARRDLETLAGWDHLVRHTKESGQIWFEVNKDRLPMAYRRV